MAKEKRKTVDQIEKEKKYKELKNKLQAEVDKRKHEFMSEFMKAWNLKNKEKIQEMVKLDNVILMRFSGGVTLSIYSDYLCL